MHVTRQSFRSSRAGFTLIELLVVISIVATLMALILPAILSARATARRAQCLNHLRNVGSGLYQFATTNGRFPAYGTWGDYRQSSGTWGNGGATGAQLRSWVVDVLPFLDHRDLADRWHYDGKHDSTFGEISNNDLTSTWHIKVLTCPSDVTAVAAAGGLSYVVNAGYANIDTTLAFAPGNWGDSRLHQFDNLRIDWNRDGSLDALDAVPSQRSGLMWREVVDRGPGGVGDGRPTPEENQSMTLEHIYDGAGQTIMATENVNAGGRQTWADPDPRSCTFVYPVDPDGPGRTAATFFQDPPLDPAHPYGLINGAPGGPDGQRPFPNSGHVGVVNIIFCDGAAKSVSERIDQSVYYRMISPAATAPLNGIGLQRPLSEKSD